MTQERDPASDETTVDYGAVEIPTTDPAEYHYTQRRAEILDIIEQKGHPAAVSQRQLADRYGVSESQISRDLDRLAEHVRERLEDRDRRAFVVDAVVQRCVEDLLEDGKPRAAAKTILEWEEWAAGYADLERLNARVEELEAATNDDDATGRKATLAGVVTD